MSEEMAMQYTRGYIEGFKEARKISIYAVIAAIYDNPAYFKNDFDQGFFCR